jgi:signal transduction histidine kinase
MLVEIKNAMRERAGESAGPFEALMQELWLRASESTPLAQASFESLEELAAGFIERGQPASLALQQLLGLGRALIEVAEGTERLDAQGVARLRQLVDTAAVELSGAIEEARNQRRAAWLSFNAHELKNPLNTIVNALWLLRERGAADAHAGRFLELAERAVHRLEDRIRDLRGLDATLGALPPGWEGRLIPKRRQ